MIGVIIVIVLVILYILVLEKCLRLITNPVHHSEEEMRESEMSIGFTDGIEQYEKVWEREKFTISRNKAVLSGEIIRNPETADQKKVAIICHGHTVNRYLSLKYAALFYRAGFQIIIYDARSFGQSTGKYCTLGQEEAKDLAEVIRYAKKVFGEDCILGLHGESMGAATVLLSSYYVQPAFIVADCPFANTELLLKQWLKQQAPIPAVLLLPAMELLAKIQYQYDIKHTNPIDAVRQCQAPICFMHGKDDKLIACDHSQMMFDVCRNDKSCIHIFPGADHACSMLSDPKGYEEKLNQFLKSIGL